MIDWSVKGRRGWRALLLLSGGLGLATNLAAMGPVGGIERARYATYVAALGGVVSAPVEYAGDMHSNAEIPAFARKYNMPCSACHTAWPELNAFGQRFRDRGYQLGNDRDSPIWVNPSYIPFAIRTTPGWRLERTTNQPVDDGVGGTVEKTITQSGFDISGADLLMMGTLYKNITFGFVPTIADGEGVGIEAAFVRFDNLFRSSWANLKVGKFEMDNMLSEKRGMMLSSNGAFYQSYHFVAPGDGTTFGLGDNQIGAEWLGHSDNSYSRVSLAVLGGVDGTPGLPEGKGYDGFFAASQAFDMGNLGLQRVGVFGYLGHRPTTFETTNGGIDPVPGTGTNNKPFTRLGAVGDFFLGNFELIPLFMHASDDKDLAGGTQDATWNSGLLELHYYVSPQLVFTQRSEIIRMSQQAISTTPSDKGNIDAFTFGYRWYPIMFSRAGLAMVGELSFTKTIGTMPLSGDGVGLDPLTDATEVKSTSLLIAFDFDF
ncbi:MAG TPA: hypothetical protein VGP80_02840 [Gemmatimonadales bacterium]|nr:hypothetical protein [Gemmatimonadales bacterium]